MTDLQKIANWMMEQGYSTGHGDTIEDLLKELEWQIAENWTNALVKGVQTEREACAKICEDIANKHARVHYPDLEAVADECSGKIRERGEK
jgi:polysaccharide pyruvyl transferase WcaK-like protein